MIAVPYKVSGDHKIPIPYKVWGDHTYMWGTIRYLFHIRYGGTIRFIEGRKTLHMWGPYVQVRGQYDCCSI